MFPVPCAREAALTRDIDLIADRFELLDRAGAGGMAVVYRARDQSDDTIVALKLLREDGSETRERFLYEARALAELKHPGIVRYVTHGITPSGERFLVMEWLDGEGLSVRLRQGPLGIPSSVALGRRIAQAL